MTPKEEAKSPEQEIKDAIREEYKRTYPNIIFNLTNTLEAKDEKISSLESEIADLKRENEQIKKDHAAIPKKDFHAMKLKSKERKKRVKELESTLQRAVEAFKIILSNDKTEYDYHGKSKLKRSGEEPGPGKRFTTPRETAESFLQSLPTEGKKDLE